MDSKKYNNIKLALGIVKSISTFILIYLFVVLGYSSDLVNYLELYSQNEYVILLLFVLITGLFISILYFPLNYYLQFYLEHKYNLSNQTFIAWIWENLKASLIGGVIGIPLLLLFFYILKFYGDLWWLPLSIVLFVVSVILAKIVPVIILPLFYKVTPIDDDDLKKRIYRLSENINLNIENIFKFNMSKETKKANAAFTGLGKTKKILLGDTLLNEFTNDEIETVIAHELGHYKYKHIIKNIIIATLTSFLTLYILAILYTESISWFGFNSIDQVAALPILSLWAMILGIVQTPLTNILSRKYEYEADAYAVKATSKKEVFINTLNKLTEQNLSDKNPHPFVEWFFYSHPSTKRRVEYIKSL